MRAVPRDPAPAVPRIDLDQHVGHSITFSVECRGSFRASACVDAERNVDAPLHQPVQPRVLVVTDDTVREADVAEPGVGEDLRLLRLRDGNAVRPERDLPLGEDDGLVRLEVGPERHAVRVGHGLHPVEVGVQPPPLDEQAGGSEVRENHSARGEESARCKATPPRRVGSLPMGIAERILSPPLNQHRYEHRHPRLRRRGPDARRGFAARGHAVRLGTRSTRPRRTRNGGPPTPAPPSPPSPTPRPSATCSSSPLAGTASRTRSG